MITNTFLNKEIKIYKKIGTKQANGSTTYMTNVIGVSKGCLRPLNTVNDRVKTLYDKIDLKSMFKIYTNYNELIDYDCILEINKVMYKILYIHNPNNANRILQLDCEVIKNV